MRKVKVRSTSRFVMDFDVEDAEKIQEEIDRLDMSRKDFFLMLWREHQKTKEEE